MTLHRSSMSSADQLRERKMKCELLKLQQSRTNLMTTSLTKKRIRQPRVEVETNPFCAEKQLADIYQQLNLNKNPRFYSISLQDCTHVEQNPRNHSSYINQSADLLASSHFDVRARAEFFTSPPSTSCISTRKQFIAPKLVSVDSSNLRKSSASEYNAGLQCGRIIKANTRRSFPPGHDQYSVPLTSHGASFGHRPNSAARMFDHLTNSVSGTKSLGIVRNKSTRRCTSTPVRTGMSVMQLVHLLAPPKAANSSFSGDKKSIRALHCWKEGASETLACSRREGFAVSSDFGDEPKKINNKKVNEELEKGFINYVYNPPRELKSGHFPPPDQTTAQLIDKYRKLAVGKLPDIF
ncbi:uncharacterized protein PHALS_03578 [Plasmopara halstedii]|uniref:Uncharacterized protein n=1 Tax=Plasmopara halstedii TaxID=4781 RepID=A0A0P1AWW8_PLAHL|nr:uncharacterized protein PHALS_03578 [Plasmopara halstedii]CEG46904.1 hypothetical protein PHALS_03578 [Plasmopara halstedii]|eukprot:XP_024583273.1 hypothetical protein PHALS_03578 [Plasmopara halstedii]